MSDIRVDTISAANGTDPVTLTKQSAAVVFASIYSNSGLNVTSLNASSFSDNGTGSGSLNFTNALTQPSFKVGVASQINAGGAGSTMRGTSGGSTTSVYDIRTYDGANSAADISYMSIVIHGDLA